MALSAALRVNLFASSYQRSESNSFWLHGNQKKLMFISVRKNNHNSSWIVQSVLNSRKSSINDNGASEPARVLLERLFAQTQRLEKMGGDSGLPMDAQLGFNLGTLETDLQAALSALKNKEEDLHDAERKILLEQDEINCAKEELELREQEIAAASLKQEKLEEELKLANLNLASQATQIEDLKVQIGEREKEISDVHSKLTLKEEELNRMRIELMTKSELAVATEADLNTKSHLLNEANEVVKKQVVELQRLRKAIQAKEDELEASETSQKLGEEKLKVVEANLEERTAKWLIAQDELKKLSVVESKHTREANESMEDFRRVKKLLADVRSELISSQKALASSRQKMDDQEQLLQEKLIELEEEKRSVMSYMTNLKDALVEVESERRRLRVAEARNKELEQDILMEKEIIAQLQTDLDRERSALENAIEGKSCLQEELDRERTELGETQSHLQVKESELVEARLEIQRLKSEHDSLQLILEEKDLELSNARKNLEDANKEITELKTLMNSREEQVMQTKSLLEEKDEHVQKLQHELNDTKLRFFDAETVVERIVELTDKLIISVKDDDNEGSNPYDNLAKSLSSPFSKNPNDDFKWQKRQLESELEFTRESLRTKELEVLSVQRALAMKDEELKRVLGRLDEKEREMMKMKEEITPDANDLRQFYSLAQERMGEQSISDLVIEKLQLEAAQVEVEVATTALYKLTEMSRDLISKASLSIEGHSETEGFLHNSSDASVCAVNDECFSNFKTEVARLSALTEQFVKEAGIVGDVNL